MSKKQKKHKKKKHRFFWFVIKFQMILIVLVIGALAFYYLSGYGKKISDMQSEAKTLVSRSTEETFRSAQTSLVYDTHGELISTLKGEKDSYYLEFEEIPAYAKAAIVSIEDKKFYKHNGIDLKAIIRAAQAVLKDGKLSQGGSTITQQLARGIFLTQDKIWERKIQEIFLAVELEKKYSKDKILEYYLNNIYFGNGYYGIQAASKGYFDKEVNNLSLSQIAFLCAIPNNPSLYDPVEHMENTIKRRDRILDNMVQDEKITAVTYKESAAEDIVLQRPKKTKNNYVETYTYYCATRILMELQGFKFRTEFKTEQEREAYNEQYSELYSECNQNLYNKGYRIYTSIDTEMQKMLQESLDQTLAEYTEVNEEGVYALQGSAVCIDNRTGLVNAVVGGRSQDMAGYTLNRAYQSFRQPGSAIKPLIVYTPALESGYTPDSVVVDERIEDGPKNSNGVFEGAMTLRQAVQKSKNTIAWKLFDILTPETGLSYIKKMNFSKLKKEDECLPASLGGFTTGASALEMASAYAAIQNDGKYRVPSCIVMILDADDDVIYSSAPEEIEVYQQNAARMMTDILKDVVVDGTGRGLSLSSTASAGKTGTTNDNKDGWFVGYTRYYTTSVWVGYDMPRELTGLSGSTYPGSIWNTFMEAIHDGLPPMDFIPYVQHGSGISETVPDSFEPDETESEEQQEAPDEWEQEMPEETEPPAEDPPPEELPAEEPGEQEPPEEEPPAEDEPPQEEPPQDDNDDGNSDDSSGDDEEYEDKDIM